MVKSGRLDRTFSALSDPTRRVILERLATGPASISDLARPTGLSLPGVMKHVRIRAQWHRRLDRLETIIERRKGGRT